LKLFAGAFLTVFATVACWTEKPGRYNELTIVASDYAFSVPARVPAGRTTFRFANNGKVRHELNISLLKPDVSIDKFLATVRADQSVQSLIVGPVGVLFAEPGVRSGSGLTVDLKQGETYAVICIFRDSAEAKRHYDLGMYSVIKVGHSQPVAPLPQTATDSIIATDYAFQYPHTVAPGRHTFLMRNEGKQRHEVNFLLLRKGVTLQRLLETEKSGGTVDSLFDGDLGLLHARGGQSPVGNLTIDMLPDRDYVIACFFKDDPKSPEHYQLGMFGSIHTLDATHYDSTYFKQQSTIEKLLGR
jgi:hypothetical protein